MRNRWRRWWARPWRYPRLVSYSDWMKLRRQLPKEQLKRARLSIVYNLLMARYLVERARHRSKVAECEELKRLVDPVQLEFWRAKKRAETRRVPEPVSSGAGIT